MCLEPHSKCHTVHIRSLASMPSRHTVHPVHIRSLASMPSRHTVHPVHKASDCHRRFLFNLLINDTQRLYRNSPLNQDHTPKENPGKISIPAADLSKYNTNIPNSALKVKNTPSAAA